MENLSHVLAADEALLREASSLVREAGDLLNGCFFPLYKAWVRSEGDLYYLPEVRKHKGITLGGRTWKLEGEAWANEWRTGYAVPPYWKVPALTGQTIAVGVHTLCSEPKGSGAVDVTGHMSTREGRCVLHMEVRAQAGGHLRPATPERAALFIPGVESALLSEGHAKMRGFLGHELQHFLDKHEKDPEARRALAAPYAPPPRGGTQTCAHLLAYLSQPVEVRAYVRGWAEQCRNARTPLQPRVDQFFHGVAAHLARLKGYDPERSAEDLAGLRRTYVAELVRRYPRLAGNIR